MNKFLKILDLALEIIPWIRGKIAQRKEREREEERRAAEVARIYAENKQAGIDAGKRVEEQLKRSIVVQEFGNRP